MKKIFFKYLSAGLLYIGILPCSIYAINLDEFRQRAEKKDSEEIYQSSESYKKFVFGSSSKIQNRDIMLHYATIEQIMNSAVDVASKKAILKHDIDLQFRKEKIKQTYPVQTLIYTCFNKLLGINKGSTSHSIIDEQKIIKKILPSSFRMQVNSIIKEQESLSSEQNDRSTFLLRDYQKTQEELKVEYKDKGVDEICKNIIDKHKHTLDKSIEPLVKKTEVNPKTPILKEYAYFFVGRIVPAVCIIGSAAGYLVQRKSVK